MARFRALEITFYLSNKAFPDSMVAEIANFLANFEQHCEQYEATQQDLSSEFLPERNQAEVLDCGIAKLEKQLTQRRAKKAQLRKRLQVLAGQAYTSK
ncbi:hypothetical protein TorRG33x02_216530 [Trema orientale]|uniref:Uncharacterized protein n=1 Tax=Trema orientale TaxID=63057 RepID=A0A2P5EAI9_TREOI|nr:hypothetical protein TorRG33x02_216530 [Trema orientale]